MRCVQIEDLVCATTEDNGCCLPGRAATKYVESFITYLFFFKYLTRTKYLSKRSTETSLHSAPSNYYKHTGNDQQITSKLQLHFHLIDDIIYRSLNHSTGCCSHTLQILFCNTTGTENVSICKILYKTKLSKIGCRSKRQKSRMITIETLGYLCCKITNSQPGQNYLCPAFYTFIQFVINNVPFSINN